MKDSALLFYNKFKFNVTKIIDKKKNSSFKWKYLINKRQKLDFLTNSDWTNVTGIGTVLGFNNLRALDIDKCNDWGFIKSILQFLGVPIDYQWVVKSGSHNGFHIIFYSQENKRDNVEIIERKNVDLIIVKKDKTEIIRNENVDAILIKKNQIEILRGNYISNRRFKKVFRNIECRWQAHLALPPTVHESGLAYEFVNEIPTAPPVFIDINKILSLVSTCCYLARNSLEQEPKVDLMAVKRFISIYLKNGGFAKGPGDPNQEVLDDDGDSEGGDSGEDSEEPPESDESESDEGDDDEESRKSSSHS